MNEDINSVMLMASSRHALEKAYKSFYSCAFKIKENWILRSARRLDCNYILLALRLMLLNCFICGFTNILTLKLTILHICRPEHILSAKITD